MHAALIVARVVDPLLVEIGDVHRAVGADLDIDGPEPGVVARRSRCPIVRGLEARAIAADFADARRAPATARRRTAGRDTARGSASPS